MKKKHKIKKKTLLHERNQQIKLLDGIRIYANLREQITSNGLFKRSYTYYWTLIILTFIGFFAAGYGIYRFHNLFLLIPCALLFSFFSVQISGFFHDAGHRSIFKSNLMNDIIGYISGFVLATAYSSWKTKHNMHHAHPNQEDLDPDIDIPLLSFTKEHMDSKKGFAKFLVKYQAYLYFPLGSLISFGFRLSSITYYIKNFSLKKIPEIILFLGALTVWFVFPFIFFDTGKALIVFFVVNFAMGFYLLNVFAPNHKGMPQLGKKMKMSFMEQQIITARNIRGNWFVDYIYLGLNYQIEHHLFPNIARNKLNKTTPYIIQVCKKYGLEFTEVGVLETNKIILTELNNLAVR